MVDKLNRININVGNIQSKNQNASKGDKAEKEQNVPEQSLVAQNHVDPDKVLDAMKRQGLHNFNHVMASGNVGSKSITEAVNQFTSMITPEMHSEITEKVKAVCAQEFPTSKIHPDVIAEAVDNIIFESLSA